jgi:hypothetical protein
LDEHFDFDAVGFLGKGGDLLDRRGIPNLSGLKATVERDVETLADGVETHQRLR